MNAREFVESFCAGRTAAETAEELGIGLDPEAIWKAMEEHVLEIPDDGEPMVDPHLTVELFIDLATGGSGMTQAEFISRFCGVGRSADKTLDELGIERTLEAVAASMGDYIEDLKAALNLIDTTAAASEFLKMLEDREDE